MKGYTTNLFNNEVYVVLVDETIAHSNEEIIKRTQEIDAKLLNVDKKYVVLASKINGKIQFICGQKVFIEKLEANKDLSINWFSI